MTPTSGGEDGGAVEALPVRRVGDRLDTNPTIASAPLPTRRTIRMRTSLPRQLVRFMVLNARMAMLAMRGHD